MDVILEYADEYLLDRVWAMVHPAVPHSVIRELEAAGASSGASLASSNLGEAAVAALGKASSVLSPAQTNVASVVGASGFLSNLTGKFASGAVATQESVAAATSLASSAAAGIDIDKLKLMSAWGRDHFLRQAISLYAITFVGIFFLYFAFAGFSYYFVFNHDMKKHPRFLKNQVRLEIESSLRAFPTLDLMTLPWFLGEVRGKSLLYDRISDYGIAYAIFSVPFFLVFTDACIYWVHRLEHHPRLYKHIHKPHHKWLVPTPFASHAFHPIDGYAQSLPYHIFVYLFPLHKFIYMGLFVFVNCWSILIHDSDMICNSPLEKVINGPSHHTLHHLYFNVNYGQYFTGCDRLGGSYRAPKMEDDPLLDVVKEKKGAKAE